MTADRQLGRLRIIAVGAAALSAAVSLTALLGWMGEITTLRRVLPGAVSMNPVSAIALLLASVALWLAARAPDTPGAPGRVLSGLVMLIGAARLIGSRWGDPAALDLLFFREAVLRHEPVARMAHSTAICLLAIGIALFFYRPGSRLHRLSRPIILPAAMFGLLAATGYLYSAEWFFHIPALHPMAFNTSVSVLALCVGITALPPPLPPLDRLVEDGVGGAMARRLLPAAFLIPFVLGYLRVLGERGGLFDLGFGTAAFVVLTAIGLALLVLLSVKQVRAAESAQMALARTVQESEQRTFRLLEGLPSGVFVVDAMGRPYYANRKSGEILGRGPLPEAGPESIAETYQLYRAGTDAILPADQVPVAQALRGNAVYVHDLEIHRSDRTVPIEVWAAPITNPRGEVEFAIATFNDISDRLETQREIDQLNAELALQVNELATVNQELETFSYSVSHDLRAPLRAVDGFSRVLESDFAETLDPEALRLLARIRGNIRRMGNLIDDLLRFSRLSRKGLETRDIDMDSLVRNVVDDLARNQPSAPVIMVGPLPSAHGDLELLRQVWHNLIENALKYSGKRSDPRIEIGGRQNAGEKTYSVRDNGVGFDMAYRDKLFGVFQRLHRQDEFEGTGVGLAIVQRVIHRHGGRIWAESAPGEGATFHFTLPAEDPNGGR